MNSMIMLKATRDSAWLLLATCVTVLLFEVLLVHALATLGPQLVQMWSTFQFLQRLMKFTFHIDFSGQVTPIMLLSIGLAHPFLLAVCWAHLVTFCTRVPVGEIDRGTADLLFSLPCSRSAVYLSNSVVCLAQIIPLAVAVWLGLWIGASTVDLGEPFLIGRFALASANYGLLLFAVCGATYCASCFVSRRSVAIGVILALLLSSFLINVVEGFLPFVQNIGFLGLLSYHRPFVVIRDGVVPYHDLAVLLSLGSCCWLLGWWKFALRDIPVG